MVYKITSTSRHGHAGATVVEFLFALGIGALVLAAVIALLVFSARSGAAMFSYVDLDNKSQNALDRFSQQIRRVQSLKSSSSTELTFIDFDGTDLTFRYDPTNRKFMRIKNGVTDVFLTECKTLQFSIFQRNPIGGSYDQYASGDTTTCKLLQVQWTCSRSLFFGQEATEAVKSAKIVIRKR